ncbi:hypothetical protein CDR19_19235 [Ectopseudomonas toyotomiensis]|uniref:Membrane protein involved in the export of O-antigen and teichoic acid n=1 Tax=Ectopseudomonas toyotomiensis TaxID=554344 RepID=A0A1I5XY12_9GAMM|nr:hypothetical protein [Pseudomonas toyotomiensis]PIA69278.1 hypothetical protein CDR19_19235 [Pseudomonas toyotomiensis]SFQ36843.1 Membrane protein involved in the export of O-antigen and teichoic acid [Pseudomonas toyotomiensis]
MAVRVVALALWVWLLVQQLPAEDFGWLASVLAVSAVCSLVAPFGIPYLFFADAHSSNKNRERWCEALGALIVIGPALAIIGAFFLDWWLEGVVSLRVVIFFVVIEVLIASLVQSAGLWGHSVGRIDIAAGLPAALTISRSIAAGLCLTQVGSEDSMLEAYLLIHVVVGALTALVMLTWVTRATALRWRPTFPAMTTFVAAWRYAAMGGAALASSELDKPLVVRVMGLQQAGHYAMAYRVCSALAMPATALAAAMLPRWVAAVAQNDAARLRYSFIAVLLAVATMGSMLMALLYLCLAAYPPGSFGLYPEAWPWMQGLAGLVVVLGLRQVTAAALIAVGLPLVRALLDMASLAILAAVAFLAYPVLGIGGVMLGCILTEACAAIAMAVYFFLALNELRLVGISSDE